MIWDVGWRRRNVFNLLDIMYVFRIVYETEITYILLAIVP